MNTPLLDTIKKAASGEENTGINPYLATGAGMALAGAATKMLDPRTTLYHGSSVENMKNIMAQGLKPAGAPGVTELVVSAYDPQVGAAAKKLVYLTKFKPFARGYAYQSEQLSKIKNPSVFDVLGIQASATPGELAKTKPLKFRLPKTEEFKAMSRVNPEIAVAKDKISLLRGLGDNIGARQQAITAKLLELDFKPLAGTVSPKYIVGNAGYQKVSPKEIIRYIRANPAKGIGALALGATGIGAIGYGLSRLLRGKNEDPSMPIIEEPKSASLGSIANKASLGLGALGSLATIAYSAAYLSDRAERRRWERRIEENLAENPPQKSKPGSKAHEQSPMGQLRALIPESTPMVIVQAAPESVKTSSVSTPMLDEIRKMAAEGDQGALNTMVARNQARAKALGIEINDISALGDAITGGMLEVDYDPSTNDIISKQIKAPRATGGLAKRIAREHSLSHELSEAEYVKRRNLLPLHSHADLGVLIDEARERALLPSDIQRKERDTRTSDLEFWESSPGGSMNDFARKILEAESNKRITRNALIKQYLEEKKYNNSLLYPGNFIDNVTANIRAAKGKPYTKNDLEAMAWNRMLDARIQYNHDKERAAALEIGAKGDKAGIIGGVLGGLGLGAGAFASFKNPKIGIPAGIAGLAAGGLMGHKVGVNAAIENEVKKRYGVAF